MSTPNASYVWLQYALYYINLTEFDKARELFDRALKTIYYREEEEKFNIWIGYINLEFKYGNNDTLDKVVNNAIQQSYAKVYLYFYLFREYIYI